MAAQQTKLAELFDEAASRDRQSLLLLLRRIEEMGDDLSPEDFVELSENRQNRNPNPRHSNHRSQSCSTSGTEGTSHGLAIDLKTHATRGGALSGYAAAGKDSSLAILSAHKVQRLIRP